MKKTKQLAMEELEALWHKEFLAEQIADLANYIKCNDITINNENDLQLAMRNWLQDGMKFYHRMTKTKDGIIVAEKMFNNYINKLND